MYCMAPSPSHSRRGGSPRWISRGMNRRGNPPKRFHPFRHCARRSAIMGHPPGCGLPGAFRRGGRIMGDTAADGNRCGRFPVSCPIFAAEQGGIVRVGKKRSLILTRIPLFHALFLFPASFCKKTQFFSFFARVRPPPHFGPFMLMAAKTVSSLWSEELLKEKKRAGLSFS